jgi:hypothetical protein
MLVTGVAGTTWTVSRGIEGTSAASHAAGTAVTAVLTAGGLDEMRSEIEAEHLTAGSLASATTTIVVSGATAPTAGQVLTATSPTAADWETPSAASLKTATSPVVVSSATAPTAGQVLTATSPTAADWETPPPQGNSISKPKIQPNGATVSDVALPSDSSTSILAVNLQTIGLAVSTIYQTVVTVRTVIYEDAVNEIVGSLDIVSDMIVVVDSAGNVFCGFNATQSPDLSRLVGTPLQGTTGVLVASANGFTVKITRPTGIDCHARCSWVTNLFENIGVEPDYPQAGSWATGGYWDADHGVGGSPSAVTSITSREGTSVLTTSGGTFQIVNDLLTSTNVLVGDGTAIMEEISSGHWGAFGGTHTPHIGFVQLDSPALLINFRILGIYDAAFAYRAIDLTYSSYPTANDVTPYRWEHANSNTIGSHTAVPPARITVVWVLHTDGKAYIIDSTGTSVGTSDAALGALIVDRFLIGTNSKFRRLGEKLPDTANPLLEAQQLYARLAVMT